MPTELTARADWEAGQISKIDLYGGYIEGKSQLVFFIHGFNNDRRRALEYYKDCFEALARTFGRSRRTMDEQIIFFTWPGDQFDSRLLSAAAYTFQISKAKEVAADLAQYLVAHAARLDSRLELSFVAHSLGARLTLEVIRELKMLAAQRVTGSRQIELKAMVLMAAAVPVGCCESGDRFPSADADREVVLFSNRDKSLGAPFRLGQLGDCGGLNPEAVGRRGNPRGRWQTAVNTGLGHGEYWSGRAPQEQMAGLFGWKAPRELASRPGQVDYLEGRTLATRSL